MNANIDWIISCPSCKQQSEVDMRARIPIILTDDSGSINCTISGEDAEKMILFTSLRHKLAQENIAPKFLLQWALPHQDINKKQQRKEEMFTPTTKLVLEEIAGGNCSTKDDAYGSSGVNRGLDFPKGLSENEATPVETLSKEPSNISEQCTKEGPEDSNPPENIEDKSSKEA